MFKRTSYCTILIVATLLLISFLAQGVAFSQEPDTGAAPDTDSADTPASDAAAGGAADSLLSDSSNDESANSTVLYFVDSSQPLTYGPPLPKKIEVVVGLTVPTADLSSDSADTAAESSSNSLSISVINITDQNNQPIETSQIVRCIVDASVTNLETCDFASPARFDDVAAGLHTFVLYFNLPQTPDSRKIDQTEGTYSGELVVQLNTNQPLTKPLKLTTGAPPFPTVLTNKIIVNANSCPQPLRALNLAALCPKDGTTHIEGTKPSITLDDYLVSSQMSLIQGFAVTESSNSGRVGFRIKGIDSDCCNSNCPGMLPIECEGKVISNRSCPAICPEYRLAIYGTINAGKYTGTVYLNPSAPGTQTIAVEAYVRDWAYYPGLVLILGMLANYFIQRRLSRKKNTSPAQQPSSPQSKTQSPAKQPANKDHESGGFELLLDILIGLFRLRRRAASPKSTAQPTREQAENKTEAATASQSNQSDSEGKLAAQQVDYVAGAFILGTVWLSGMLVLYINNPTYGASADYVKTFLWGAVGQTAVETAVFFLKPGDIPAMLKKIRNNFTTD